MTICAVICELNPLHNGHAHIFNEAKKLTGCDFVLAVMGGNFCQRAEAAIIDEYSRTKAALLCGADAVIELPAIYSSASADTFALGSVLIINSLKHITHLVMGSECGDSKLLESLATVQSAESKKYTDTLKSCLAAGKSYARALTAATASCAADYNIDEATALNALNKPNNILAVAYKKMLIKTNSKIKFKTVLRIPEQMSASNIRENFADSRVKASMPKASYDITAEEIKLNYVRQNEFDALLFHAVINNPLRVIAATPDCAEGLEYKIKKAAESSADFQEMLKSCSSARYTTGRIKRICLYNLLGVTKNMQQSGYKFSRLLGVKQEAAVILKNLPSNIITNKAAESVIPKKYRNIFETDKTAVRLYAQLTHRSGGLFYSGLIKI